MSTLDSTKFNVVEIGITKDGRFLTGKNTLQALQKSSTKGLKPISLLPAPKNIDIVFPVLHGPYGEDGTVQGLLELGDVAYVGCGTASSAAAMNKLMAKMLFKAHDLPQADFTSFNRSAIERNIAFIEKNIGFPCFVKPTNLGSSVGISKVKKASQLRAALKEAARYDSRIVVEKAVPQAREIECAVLGNEDPIISVPGEVVPSGEFYDFASKYIDGKSELIIPAPLTAAQKKQIQKMAAQAYGALQCRGMARVDFLLSKKTGKIYINEVNTIPGFTSISMYPKLFEASGISYKKLIEKLIELGLEAHKEKQKNQVSFDSGSDWYRK